MGLAGQTAISPRALSAADARVLARLKGLLREHGESDLRCYLTWCAGQSLDPLAAQRPHLELKVIMLCHWAGTCLPRSRTPRGM